MKVLSYTVLADGLAATPLQLAELMDTTGLAMVISLGVPVVVAFVTKKEASDRVKAITNLLSVAVAAVIAFVIKGGDGQPVNFRTIATVFIGALTASLVAYKGFWKPTSLAKKIADIAPRTGLGTPVPAVNEKARPGGDVL